MGLHEFAYRIVRGVAPDAGTIRIDAVELDDATSEDATAHIKASVRMRVVDAEHVVVTVVPSDG